MSARHVFGIGAVAGAAEPALMSRDPAAAMEHLDGALRRSQVHLLTDERVRDRVQEAVELDVIVDVHAGQALLGKDIILVR